MGRERQYRLDIPFDSMTFVIDIEISRTGARVSSFIDSLQNPKATPMQDVSIAMAIVCVKKPEASLRTHNLLTF